MTERYEQFSASVACLYRHVQKIERTEMARYGLKGPHAQCLLAISRYADGITATRLCDVCDKDKAAVSRTLAELEQAGMICRPDGDGKRYRLTVRLTDKGAEIAGRVKKLAALAVEQAGEGLTDENRSVFYASLDLIAENLRRISRNGLKEE